jgi:hypothetical protein
MFNKLSKDLKTESNLIEKILQYINEYKSYAIISPFIENLSFDENLKKLYQLKVDLRKFKLGFLILKGFWEIEESDEQMELSLLIPNISKIDAIKLGEKYNQYAIIYCQKGNINLICTNKNCAKDKNSYLGCIYKTLNGTSLTYEEFNNIYLQMKIGTKNQRNIKFKLKSSFEYVNSLGAINPGEVFKEWLKK